MKSKYLEVYESIRNEIKTGQYPEGSLLPTELELCKRFSASRPTIAKALEMLRIEQSIERKAGFGTVVLKSELTHGKQIGLLIPHLKQTEIFEPICTAIEESCREYYLRTIRPNVNLSNPSEAAKKLCSQFINEKVSGVFFTPVEHEKNGNELNHEIIARLKDARIPVVLLDRDITEWPSQTEYDLVGIDNIQAGYVVAGHLIECGCKNLVFATQPDPAMTVRLRIMGCREALRKNNLNPDSLKVLHLSDLEIDPILDSNPDGLVCANDVTAAQLMPKLLEEGIRIPQQLKVAAFDDVKYASLLSVPLTTYHQPCEDIGRAAADAMMLRIDNPTAAPRRTTLQGKLMERTSSNLLQKGLDELYPDKTA